MYKQQAKRIALNTLGGTLTLVGFAGIFLPILDGFLFITVGVYILSFSSEWVRSEVDSVRHASPLFARYYDGIDRRFRKMFNL